MGSRLDLQTKLEEILGSRNVYFQPPESVKIQYPCIVYQRSSIDVKFANDNPYSKVKKYTVTVIDKNPDSDIPDKLILLPQCIFTRHYTADNLNHDSYNLYF